MSENWWGPMGGDEDRDYYKTQAETLRARAEKAEAELDELKTIVQLTVESQGWDGNNPDDDRWANLYKRAREALEGKP